ncbi:MAG: hypothetical protein L0Y60_02170 [Beijerinckiaceae bacterium]|nr:hypothetical protein [Beijerinckiaceae bacterium]
MPATVAQKRLRDLITVDECRTGRREPLPCGVARIGKCIKPPLLLGWG